ncbi:MAG TPA: DUF5916 domain-containing protein [Gemmatimonadaceae bacterium]|nr:DUF5916 domain-containing protein [Gemmatimonadaceae bacterium]
MRLSIAVTLLASPALLQAQTASSANPATPPSQNGSAAASRDALPALPTLTASRAPSSIRIDGRLDDEAWSAARPMTGFIQMDPDEGQPATEDTEVRVLYDDQALYIGVRMFDSEPEKIRARLGRRDEGLTGTDLLEVYIDSYHDRVSGYVFRITPAGAIRDASVSASGGTDGSWDAVWEAAAAVDSLGWVAEYRIPFSQLRYNPRSGPQTFGIDFRRVVSRKSETTAFAFTPRRATGGPGRWATLGGLTDLPRARYLELMPYVTGRAEFLNIPAGNPFRGPNDYQVKGGLDLKYGLTSGLTLSGTINPDFGQVEVDPARVNLTANELFFPERRPFFVEGAGIFSYGRIRTFNSAGFPTLFHSRRIGRPPQRRIDFSHPYADMPEEATIAAAAKIAGQPRPGLSVGILDAFTMRESAQFETSDGTRGNDAVEPQTNYFVGRVRQDLRQGNTQIGLFTTAVNRNLEDAPLAELLRRDAYFVGLDFNQSWKDRMWVLDGSIGRSAVFGTPESMASTQRSSLRYFQRPDLENEHFDPARTALYGTAWQISAAKMSGRHTIGNVTFQAVEPGFEVNDVGFHSQAGYKALSTIVGLRKDEPGRYLRNWLIGPFSGQRWNYDGDMIDEYYGFHVDGRFKNMWSFNTNYIIVPETVDDRLTRGGPLALRPARRNIEFGHWSDSRRVYMFEQWYYHSRNEAGGWEHNLYSSFTIRPSTALRVSFSPQVNAQKIAAQYITSASDTAATGTFGRRYIFGDLRYNQLSLETRVDWTFTPNLSLQVFAQPLVASGEYQGFKSLRQRKTFDFDYFSEEDGTLTRDDNGLLAQHPGGTAIRIGNPDFSTRSLVGNAVLRWEYRPGSALFFVWQQRRAGDDSNPGFRVVREVGSVFREAPENVFAIKASYWFGR